MKVISSDVIAELHPHLRTRLGQGHQHDATECYANARHLLRTASQEFDFRAAEDIERDADCERHLGAIGRQRQEAFGNQHLVGADASPAGVRIEP